MSTFRKITLSAFGFCLLFLMFTPFAAAQSSLDDIKARLEEEGISVIDYSTPEGQWGALPTVWIQALTSKGITSLKVLADNLKDYYVEGEGSLTALRRQLAVKISEKSQLTVKADIDNKQLEIEDLQEKIADKETQIKNEISTLVGGTDQAGKNLLFNEVDFYYNYNKWGRLPNRLIGILEKANYTSLQHVVEKNGGVDQVETNLKLIPELSADDIRTITDSIAILSSSGERQINEVARAVVNTLKNLVAGLAVIWLVYAGIRLVFAQGEENVISEQKRAFFYAGLGLVAILLVSRGIDILYGPAGVARTTLKPDEGFSAEVYGVVTFIRALVGIIAILFIVFSGIRMMFAAGEESELTKQKSSLLWIGVGLILIAINQVIIKQLFIIPVTQSDQIKTSNVTAVINTIGSVLQFILGFVGLIAFGVLVYGAGTLVANYGDDEMVSRAKKIITNAVIGILVIISAYTIVATLVVFR